MPDTYTAELDGFSLEIETVDDTFEKAIVRHEFPYRNGAELENMGLKARSIRFRCYFWDDGADHTTYDDHIDFVNHLQSLDQSELVHPKYGPIKGEIESVSIHQDDRDRTAEIEISFVQQWITDIEIVSHEDVEAQGEEAYTDGIDDQEQTFSDDVTEALGPEASDILGAGLDPDLGIVEQFANVSLTARNYLKTVETFVGTLEGTLNVIANPANSLIATINYGVSLPGRVIGSVARCLERYALLYASLKSAPARFLDSLIGGVADLAAVSGAFSKTTAIGAASFVALQAASIYKDDETLREDRKKNEGRTAFDILGNYTPPDPPPDGLPDAPMTVGELEDSLAAVRSLIQSAIDLARPGDTLKKQALQLQNHVGTIKLEREKMVTVVLDNPLPLHLVCLRYGLPYTAAERLLSINDIVNPNAVSGEVNVYA